METQANHSDEAIVSPMDTSKGPRSQVLTNADLLEMVFSFFDPLAFFEAPYTIRQSTRVHLLAACLTCKAFSDPALNLLWKVIPSIIPVLKILPTFVKVNDIYTTTGPIQPSEMARMEHYSRKVRYMYLDSASFRESIAGHVLFRLLHTCQPILPALRMVYSPSLIGRNIESFNSLFLLNPPTLTDVIIHGIVSSTEDVLCSFLSAISQCASLSRIWLDGRLTPNSIDLFKQLEQLKTLQLSLRGTTLHPAPFLRSCNLPRLQSLDIELRDQSSCSGAADVMGVEDFHSLEHLKLKGRCSELFKLLGYISTQSLKTMSLSFMSSRTASSQDIVACIQECGRLGASLRDLELTGTSLRNDLSVLPGALAPIKCCTMLRTFKFSAATISLKDDNIHQLCGEGNWRHLEVLELPHCVRGEAPSLLSLITLTEHCPQLRRISLCIDLALQDYESLQAQKTLSHLPTNLTHLSILKPMEDSSASHYLNTVMLAVGVSEFLDHWFPKLIPDNIVAPTADQEWWRGVKTMMGKYRQIREEVATKTVN